MHTHRPVYATLWAIPGAMIRVSSDVKLLWNYDKLAADSTENWAKEGETNFCEHNVDFFNADDIMLRFHYVAVNPGKTTGDVTNFETHQTLKTCCIAGNCAATCCDKNYDWASGLQDYNVIVGNLRSKKIEHRIPLQHCGDGVVDSTYFEDCEINQTPSTGAVSLLASSDATYGQGS